MQFSDSTSSSSSAASTPRRRGGDHFVAVNASTPLASAACAFHGMHSSERHSRDNEDAQRLYGDNSSLRIQLTAGLHRADSPVSGVVAAPPGAKSADDDGQQLRIPSTQQAPSFFAKAPNASSANQRLWSDNSEAELDTKAFRMTQSPSSSTSPASSASSLTSGPQKAKASASAMKRLQLRRLSASKTPSMASSASSSTPLAPAARRSSSSSSSSSGSSASNVVLHRLHLPHATSAPLSMTAAAPPAASVPPPAHHVDPLRTDVMTTPPTAETSATLSLHPSGVEAPAMPASDSTLTDTGHHGTAGARFSTSSASPLTPNPAGSYRPPSNAPAAVCSAAPVIQPTSQLPTNTSFGSKSPSDSLLPHIKRAAAAHSNGVYSNFEDLSKEEVGESELNSSAASRAAHAALDAAEQLHEHEGHSDPSPAQNAATPPPPPPSEQAHTSEGEVQPTKGDFIPREKGCNGTVSGTLVSNRTGSVHTPPSERWPPVSDVERVGLDAVAAAEVSFDSGVTAATRRQPPPPPTPSTTTKKSPSSSSAMRHGVESDDTTSISSGDRSSDTELTVEQQNPPIMTQGTFTTHTAPVKATQAVVSYNPSALPPNRSSSSSSSHSSGNTRDCGGIRGGSAGGDGDSPAPVSDQMARAPVYKMRHNYDSSGDDTGALSPQLQTVMEYSGKLEEAAIAPNVGSAKVPPTTVMAGGTVNGANGQGVATAASLPGFLQHLHHPALQPAATSEMNGETKRAATVPTRPTIGSEASASRASAALMPPSPSQARTAETLDSSSSLSSSSGDGTAAVLARQSTHSNGGQALPSAERDAGVQRSESDAVRRVLVMPLMPDFTSSSSTSSRDVGGNSNESGKAIDSESASVASSEQAYIEEKGNSSDRHTPPSHAMDAIFAKDMPTAHARVLPSAGALDSGCSWMREEEEEEEGRPIHRASAEEQDGNPLALQEASRWDDVLGEMELVDCSVVSRVYQQPMPRQRTRCRSNGEDEEDNIDSEDGDEYCIFKVVSLFPIAAADHCERWPLCTGVQRRLLALAEEMRATQRALDEAGLTAAQAVQAPSAFQHVGASGEVNPNRGEAAGCSADDPEDAFAQRRRRTTCAGVSEVYVDSRCRLIAQLEVAPYTVPLRHLVATATSGTGLRENEVLALIRTVVCKAATMHNAGFVHGALHAGNVLLSSYDGDAVLAQPCGLMSQSSWLPCDLSVISVARAYAMAPFLPKVWGARQSHVGVTTSTRLGFPQRPNTAELITYHNLAALGWLHGNDAENARQFNGGGDSAESSMPGTPYTPIAADDLYAVGMIAFLIYCGVPPFHMTSLWAVVERLTSLGDDYRAAMQCSSLSVAAARQEARRVVAEFCFGTCQQSNSVASLSSVEPMQQRAVARFRPEFEQALQSFIVDCVEASCWVAMLKPQSGAPYKAGATQHVYTDAQELLSGHPLFVYFALPEQADEDGAKTQENTGGGPSAVKEESQQTTDEGMRDTVHRVAYPAFCTWARAREDCGSAPHMSRLHSNAVFTARCTALCEGVSAAAPYDDQATGVSPKALQKYELRSRLSILSPHVVGVLQGWQAPFLSGEAEISCGHDHQTDTRTCEVTSAAVAGATRYRQWPGNARSATDAIECRHLPSLMRPSTVMAPAWLFANHDDDGGAEADISATALAQQEDALATQPFSGDGLRTDGSFVRHPHLRTLTLARKQNGAFSLSRPFVLSCVLPAVDTLVLQHLADCTVTVLAPFRYIVLDALQRCEVRLGPCESCVLRDVHDCPLIAVAARQISGNNVTETHLSWSEQGSRRPLLKCSRGVTTSLYGLLYKGLVEDYSMVGLALEHAVCFADADELKSDSAEVDDSVAFRSPAMARRRTVELLASTAASENQSQAQVELCLAPEAPYDLTLLSSNTRYVHSGRQSSGMKSSWMPPPDVFHFFGELAEKDVVVCDVHGGTRDGEARPVVFLIGALGDVVVERCSHCTIVVAGTPSNLQASKCHDCQLIFMARESVIEDCARVECVALVTEYLLLRECDAVRVRPLFLHCPFSDEVLRRVVDGSVGGAEEEAVISAYEAGRLDELNAVLRGVGQGVYVEASQNVVVEDIGYYYHRSGRTDDGEHEEGEDGAEGDGFSVLSVAYVSIQSSTAVASSLGDASAFMAEAAQSLAEHLSVPCYLEPLQRYSSEKKDTSSHADRPVVSFHDLLNCSVLRLRGSLCPLELQAQSTSRDSTAALVDVCVERVHGGLIYVEDVVHTLCLRHCVGPLDVVVCASATVLMEACVGVQLRTACVNFNAMDCIHCHLALHVNNAPQYQRCRSVQTSALNITAGDFDALLTAAGVDLTTNLYDAPLLVAEEREPTVAAGSSGPSLESRGVHAFYGGCVDSSTAPYSTADMCAVLLATAHREQLHPQQGGAVDSRLGVPPDQVQRVMSVLRQPVTVVPPLPGLCVSPNEAPFLEELEAHVGLWAKRPLSVSREEAVAIALYALADLAEVYSSVTEWAETTDPVRFTEAGELVAECDASLDLDAPPQLLVTRAAPSPPTTTSASSTPGNLPRQASDAVQQRTPSPVQQQQLLLLETEQCRTAGDSSVAGGQTPAMTMLLGVGVEEGAPGTEDSVEEVVIRRALLPSLPSPLSTRYADSTHVPKNNVDHTSSAEVPQASPVTLRRPSRPGNSPRHPRHGGLASFESTTLSHAAASSTGSSAAGLGDGASMIEDGASVNSSVTAPPLPPGPTYALDPTNFGASSTMDVFYRTQRDTALLATGTTGPLMEDDGGAYSVTAHNLDGEGLEFTSASPSPDHIRSPAMTDGITGCRLALVSPVGSSGHEGAWSGPQSFPVAANFNMRDAEARAQWPSSLQKSPRFVKSEVRSSHNGDEMLDDITAPLSTNSTAGAKRPPTALGKEEDEPHYTSNAVYSSLRTSSSSLSEYRRRGVTSYAHNAEHVAGGGDDSAGESQLPETNFLHVSQDSSLRRLELNSPTPKVTSPTFMSARGEGEGGEASSFSRVQSTMLVPPASGPAAPPKANLLGMMSSPEVITMQEADADVRALLQQVEEARKRFARNQRSWQSPKDGGLEARVRAAVAKLTALKATCAEAV
ncbi:Tubulin binding cofactor C [Leishmania braziliensis]|nr:Tubulin binding cofactor C [Leishmania braziliensis]